MHALRWLVLAAGMALAPMASGGTLLEDALVLDEGKVAPRDAAKAAALYQRAAEGGDAFAHLRLGHLYETGDGVPHDYARARRHYQAAVDGGVEEARIRLAVCLLEGWGGPVDREGFAREVMAAAKAGVTAAQRMLASMYYIGLGVPKDQAAAVRWLEQASAQGDKWATYAVGREAEAGRVDALMPSHEVAKNWYQLSAEREYLEGMRAMARVLLDPQAERSNWEVGRRWLELATASGDSEAPYMLAVSELFDPAAPSRDEARARAWIVLASQRGNERATEVVEQLELGRPLLDTLRYVMSVPFEDRYVQRSLHSRHSTPGGDRRPAVFQLVQPVYPESLRILGVEGDVVVDFIVNTTGRVVSAHVERSSHPLFSERAVRAVEQWRFEPGQKDGRLVNTRMKVPVLFRLPEEQFEGIDGSLRSARDRAIELGGAVAADATDLKPATIVRAGPFPQKAVEARAVGMLLLVIDAKGRAIRGHVLHAKPTELGEEVLQGALQGEYAPPAQGSEGHVMLIYGTASPARR